MALDNDTRGWIMTGISGIACCIGASIICIDLLVRLFPRMHSFTITESDAFLSASLSLSFGVMLYSALYSMLPQSKTYFEDAGYPPRAASWLLIGLFLSGVVGIRLLSGVFHRFIPSHVVDCDHTHNEDASKDEGMHNTHEIIQTHQRDVRANGHTTPKMAEPDDHLLTEESPLLSSSHTPNRSPFSRASTAPESTVTRSSGTTDFVTAPASRRVSLFPLVLSRTFSRYIPQPKPACDESGPCMGFSDPCGIDCFKAVQRRGTTFSGSGLRKQVALNERVDDLEPATLVVDSESSPHDESRTSSAADQERLSMVPDAHRSHQTGRSRSSTHHYHLPERDRRESHSHQHRSSRRSSAVSHQHSIETDHHHHVPTNAFLSVGLQTSLAIALHKLPEGFITYATNHANPTLGFTVFMALFIHNITEGFAMSLPLYLALKSRVKAIAWSAFLGGVSQPLGAGIAALWFRLAKDGGMSPSEGVYGGMFAVTSGVMTSVALTLYSESLQLSHNKSTCIAFAFVGIGILGVSYALTAK